MRNVTGRDVTISGPNDDDSPEWVKAPSNILVPSAHKPDRQWDLLVFCAIKKLLDSLAYHPCNRHITFERNLIEAGILPFRENH